VWPAQCVLLLRRESNRDSSPAKERDKLQARSVLAGARPDLQRIARAAGIAKNETLIFH